MEAGFGRRLASFASDDRRDDIVPVAIDLRRIRTSPIPYQAAAGLASGVGKKVVKQILLLLVCLVRRVIDPLTQH